MSSSFSISILCVVLGLAGCATVPCTGNPATDSYSCAERGLKSGLYQRQTDNLRQRRHALEQEKRQLVQDNRTLQVKLADGSLREQDAARRVAESNQTLADLMTKLSSLSEQQQAQVHNYQQLQAHALDLSKRQRDLNQRIFTRNHMNEDDAEALRVQTSYIDGLKRQIEAISVQLGTQR